MTKERVSKKQILADVASDLNMPVEVVANVFDAVAANIFDNLIKGRNVSLTGIGTYYLQRHLGHPVQFEGRAKVKDYLVFKFSASDVLNRKLRDMDARGEIEGVPHRSKRKKKDTT